MIVLLRCLLIAGLMAGTYMRSQAQADVRASELKATYGAWKLKCAQLEGAKQNYKCSLVQDIKLADQRNMYLTISVLRAYDDPGKYILRIIAPLGIVIPRGVGLKIDNSDIGNLKVLKCVRDGCLTDVLIDNDLMNKLKTGKTASFIIFPTPDKGIGFPTPLEGFTEGLAGLN